MFKWRNKLVHPKYTNIASRSQRDSTKVLFEDVARRYPPNNSNDLANKAIDQLLVDKGGDKFFGTFKIDGKFTMFTMMPEGLRWAKRCSDCKSASDDRRGLLVFIEQEEDASLSVTKNIYDCADCGEWWAEVDNVLKRHT